VVSAAAAAGEGGAQDVTGGSAGRGGGRPASGLRSALGLFLAKRVEASEPTALEAGHDPTIRPLTEPLAAAALDQQEEKMPSWARAQELHDPL
jgi:hypothetical protein